MGWHALAYAVAALLLVYVLCVGLLWECAGRRPGVLSGRDAVRLPSDVLRLVRRLACDQSLPRSVRVALVLVVLYLASPIDLVPDFVPVVGFADDVVVVALVLRRVVRSAGTEALTRHWPGTPDGLRLIQRLAGVA